MLNPQWATTVSPIELLVTRACDASLHEANYALHLEVAEYINQKKANNPRDAAMLIARLACNRNPHVALLALALLETLVQSCGYPFHLQISTKEFLNELVRRFPDRPPPFPGPVMSRILETIQSWKETICVESRWREDLTNILDMHRLLMHKGYRFRHVPRAAPSASSSANTVAANLKSASELEAEDREAQSAKLQELIRRGTPKDLLVAQELMKSLAGADPAKQPDYRGQALSDLERLESKVILLGEMLDNANMAGGERTVPGDVYEQVANILTTSRPKIQKWISDAEQNEDDSESLDTLLQLNDHMNTVLSRYDAFKRGDYAAAANPVPSQYSSQAANATSLIDFDDIAPPATSSNPANELDGLFGLGTLSTPTSSPPPINPATRPTNAQLGGSIMLPSTPTPGVAAQQPTMFGHFQQSHSNGVMNGHSMPTPHQQSQPTTSQVQGKDPFADLAGLF
ncbi:VHS domain-containing protein [Mycena indigotica]|uniref:VHS domain-containing protein n=1 Tax=Mycena indigotica TaxID=2126181 RepID=A0A8H6W5P0_9AGAR|nr:VHS domain-containing protein [Mycena indigotica]KAF7303751.1 VHS domain-containing protein [Mycena indigotica]